jgi:hypothetical protein
VSRAQSRGNQYAVNPTAALKVRRALQTQTKRIEGIEQAGVNRPLYDNQYFPESPTQRRNQNFGTSMALNFKVNETVQYNHQGLQLKYPKPMTADRAFAIRKEESAEAARQSYSNPVESATQASSIAHMSKTRHEEKEHVRVLETQLMEQQQEIKQLRQHLQSLFAVQEEQIVASSFHGQVGKPYLREVSNIHQLY